MPNKREPPSIPDFMDDVCPYLLYMGTFGFREWIPIFLLFAVFCLYRAGFRHLIAAKKQYASLSTLFGGSDWLRSITISDETISIKDGTASIDIPTANLIQIKEKGDEVCLMMRNKMTVRLYKSSFVDGSWEACKELLTAGRK